MKLGYANTKMYIYTWLIVSVKWLGEVRKHTQ